jgi:nucleoid-associated protein YgaU
MGLFDFLKDKGEKLFEGDEQQELEKARKADPEITTLERMKARALRNLVLGKGLKIENFQLVFDDGVVTVEGHAASQEEREKTVLLLGNVRGILRVDDRLTAEAPAAAPEPEATFYTVQSGDTLSKIAKAHYGDAMKYPVIFEANRPMLKDPDRIYPGQVLRIPPL